MMNISDEEGQEENYVRIKVLGKGAFGEAVLYQKPENNALVVWKEIDLNRVSSRSFVEVQNEIEILSLLNHPNIVAYFNHYFHENMLYIEMEYANGGTLFHKIGNQTALFDEDTVLWTFFEILSAITYIHDKNILHRDIKTLNIFLNKSGLLKLGDFGMSKIIEGGVMADTVVGTPYYMSPEIIKGQKYNAKSDIWAVGCVLHEMLTLKKTFEASNTLKLANDILKGEIASINSQYSSDMSELLNMCFKLEASDRASAMDLLNHDIMKKHEKEFSIKVDEMKLGLGESRPVSRGQLTTGSKDWVESSTVPIVTQSSTEVYFWGGGKTQPQMNDVFVEGKSAITASLGDHHVGVVTIEKELYTWLIAKGGDFENNGQLGHGDVAFYKAPKVLTSFEGVRIVQVSCGSDFTACTTDCGILYMFGSNYFGCLGVGKTLERSTVPCKVVALESNPVNKIACGDHHVIALTEFGKVYAWGCGEFGRLGTGHEDDHDLPIEIAIPGSFRLSDVACGTDFTLFLTITGKVLACGSNEHNKLGMNQTLKGVAPEQLSYDIPCISTASLVKPLSNIQITFIAAGKTHSAVLDESGRLLTFGSNDYGQLGQGDSKPRSKIVQVKNALAGKNVVKMSCGDGFTVAVTSDNQVYSWGLGENGRLGLDLSLQSKGVVFTTLPKSIFGTLHRVKQIGSRGWNTILIAEKIFSQKALRPSSATASRPMTAAGHERTNATGKKAEFKEILSTDIHIVSFESECTPQHVEPLGNESSDVPTWLAAELQANELIPIAKQQDEAAIDSIKIPSAVDGEKDVLSFKTETSTIVNAGNVNLLNDTVDYNVSPPMDGKQSLNCWQQLHNEQNDLINFDSNSKIEMLKKENEKLKNQIIEKDKQIAELEKIALRCHCTVKRNFFQSESEEVFDV